LRDATVHNLLDSIKQLCEFCRRVVRCDITVGMTQERLAGFKRYTRAAQPSPERVPQVPLH